MRALSVLFQLPNTQNIKIQQLPQFLSRISSLLQEGYVLVDCLTMLLPYHVKDPVPIQQALQVKLQNGASVTEIFQLVGVKKQYLLAISLAEINGQLGEILQKVSEQMTFDEQMKGRLVKMLTYPTLLFLFLIVLFVVFRVFFLPNITAMFSTRAVAEEQTGIKWSNFFLHVPDYFVVGGGFSFILLTLVFIVIKRKRVDLQLKIILRLPLISYFWRLIITRQFARSLGGLLLTGFSLQQALVHLKEQHIQPQIAYIAKLIENRVVYGDSLGNAIVLAGFFYPKFDQFIKHGEASGHLGREMLIYCDLLDAKLTTIVQTVFAILQPMLFIIIAICVIAAYLSILIPLYSLLDVI